MPPLVFLAVVGAAGYAGFKLFSKLVEQAQTPSRSDAGRTEAERARQEARANAATTRDLGELELDEKTGVYKPKSGA
jgi:N-acetyl-gamma-glutamylphosphate reductase